MKKKPVPNELTHEAIIDLALEKAFNHFEDKIYRLEQQNARLKKELEEYKKPKKLGRPFKPKRVGFSQALLGSLGVISARPKKKVGAPIKYTKAHMIEMLQEWDAAKDRVAKELGKNFIADKYFLEEVIRKNGTSANYKKSEVIKQLAAVIKYFRDETGIRQKRKTP